MSILFDIFHMLLGYCYQTLYFWLLLVCFSMEYSGFASMAGSNCGTCVVEARQSRARRRTSRKTALNNLLNLEPGGRALSAPFARGETGFLGKAREYAEAMHQEKRREGSGVDRKNAPDDRGRIIRYAAR